MSIQTSSSDLGGYILNNEFVEEDLDDNMSLTSDGVRQRFFLIVLRETFRKQSCYVLGPSCSTMVLSCSRFMADASHLRRMKLTVDRRMKHSMLSMIVTGLPITQELAQEKQLAWPSAPGNQTDERKCCK